MVNDVQHCGKLCSKDDYKVVTTCYIH